jgi:hypothetical protein
MTTNRSLQLQHPKEVTMTMTGLFFSRDTGDDAFQTGERSPALLDLTTTW